ncbi:MAG: Branched-chain alpha-keto acid dehydrogenase, E1 component, alpha subunit, partial [uncultured Nocardioidaceae bacterium]
DRCAPRDRRRRDRRPARGRRPRTRGRCAAPAAAAGHGPAADPRGRAAGAPRLPAGRLRRGAARLLPRHGPRPPLGRRGDGAAAAGRARHLGVAARPGGRPDRCGPRAAGGRHRLPDLPRARRRVGPRGGPAARHGPVPRRRQRRLGPGRARLQPVHDRHRRPVPARHRVRHGRPARRRGERRPGLPRRRRDEPGRGQRGDGLRRQLRRARGLLLPEQPVRDQRAAGAPVQGAAVPPCGRVRLPRHPGRRQRRPGRARGDPRRPAGRPRGSGTDVHRGLHLPDGRAHHVRRPDPLPAGRRGRGVEAARPDRPPQGLPLPQRAGRRRLLRGRRRRGRPAGGAHPQRHGRHARAPAHQHVRRRLRRADPTPGRAARGLRGLPRELRGRRAL